MYTMGTAESNALRGFSTTVKGMILFIITNYTQERYERNYLLTHKTKQFLSVAGVGENALT